MNRDSSCCAPRSNGFCGTEHDKYAPGNEWIESVNEVIQQTIEHAFEQGLDRVYQLCWEAGRHLIEGEVDQTRMCLGRAMTHADDPGRWIIRDALQLLEALDEDPRDRDEATDADVARAVGGDE